MDNLEMQNEISDIKCKLDFLIAEANVQKSLRKEIEELKEDLMRVGKDVFKTTVEELDDIHDYIHTGDVLYLSKKVLRNIRNITDVVIQFESMVDLVKDILPISREVVFDFMNKLDDLDKKGYFLFFKEISQIMERLVETLPKANIEQFRDNMPKIITTLMQLMEPEVINFLSSTATSIKESADMKIENVTTTKLLKEALSKESKKNILLILKILQGIKK